MQDLLLKGRFDSLPVSFQYAVTTELSNELVLRHGCDPVAAHLFTRALNVAALAASTGGPEERLNLRWTYEGALKAMVVDAGADGTIRGLINPPQLGDVEDVAALYGDTGEIRVVRSRAGVVTASGTIEACFMDVVDDLAAFLCLSDQVESSATSMVGFTDDPQRPIQIARGLMLQALPGADLTHFQRIRDRLNREDIRALLSRLNEPDRGLDSILAAVLEEEVANPTWTLVEAPTPRFLCTCGPDKLGTALRALSYADRMDIVQKKEDVAIRCHFCNERHVLTVDECIRAWNDPVA